MDVAEKTTMEGYMLALKALMRRSLTGRAGTVFSAGRALTKGALHGLNTSAAKREVDIVYLEFGPVVTKGPRCIKLIMPRNGACHLYSDCVLWCDADEGPLMIVSRKGVPGHFLLEDDDKLFHHKGRPAKSLGDGMARADSRLLAKVAAMTDEPRDGMAHVAVEGDRVTATLGGKEMYRTPG